MIQDLPFFCIIGVFGGLLGSFFVATNYFMSKLRKKYLGTNKTKKIIEVMVFVLVTSTICFYSPSFLSNQCYSVTDSSYSEASVYLQHLPD